MTKLNLAITALTAQHQDGRVEVGFCGACLGMPPILPWRNRTNHPPSILLRGRFKFTVLGRQHFNDVIHHLAAFFDMGHFAAPKHDGHLDFVLVSEETKGLFDFKVDVMLACLGTKPNFFGLRLMRLVFVSLLALFVFVLAEVHDPADGRAFIGCNLNQIETVISGSIDSIFGCNNS